MENLIFGRTWEQIEAMQQKACIQNNIIEKPIDEEKIKKALEFLNKYGEKKLKEEAYGYYDILVRAKLI